jgi:hypothetical protein
LIESALGRNEEAAELARNLQELAGSGGYIRSLQEMCPASALVLVGQGPPALDQMREMMRGLPEHYPMRIQLEPSVALLERYEEDMDRLLEHSEHLEISAQRLERWGTRAEVMAATCERAAQAIEALNMVRAVAGFVSAHRTSQRVEAAGEFGDTLSALLIVARDTARTAVAHSLEGAGFHGPAGDFSAASSGRHAEQTFLLGPSLGRCAFVLSFASAGCALWKAHHIFEREGDTQEHLSEQIEALSSILGTLSLITPPPIDGALGIIGGALTGLKAALSYLWDFYYSPELQRLEMIKRKAALGTDLAKRPRYYLPQIKFEGQRIVARSAVPMTQALVQKVNRESKLLAMIVHKPEEVHEGDTQGLIYVPLGSRARLPAGFDGRSYTPMSHRRVFRAVTFEPRLVDGRLEVDLPADLVPVPQWGWPTDDAEQVMEARARFEYLRTAGYETRPFVAIAQLLLVERSMTIDEELMASDEELQASDEHIADELYDFHFGGHPVEREELLCGTSRSWEVQFSGDVASGFTLVTESQE